MYYAQFMEVSDAMEDLLHAFSGHGFSDSAFANYVLEELTAGAEFHHYMEIALIVESFVELDDIGVVHLT